MELTFDDFSLNFLGKNRLTIRKLFFNIYAGHKHVRIFGATGIPRDLRLGVRLEKNNAARFQAALHQTMQSFTNVAWEMRGDRND